MSDVKSSIQRLAREQAKPEVSTARTPSNGLKPEVQILADTPRAYGAPPEPVAYSLWPPMISQRPNSKTFLRLNDVQIVRGFKLEGFLPELTSVGKGQPKPRSGWRSYSATSPLPGVAIEIMTGLHEYTP